jgi:hypothetical protein
MANKINSLAEELTGIALRQLQTAYLFKVPRLNRIRQFRELYNNVVPRQKRIRYNVPIPIFSGMIDTLNAQMADELILKFQERDPADWMSAHKTNAFIDEKQHSMAPGDKWNAKFRASVFECSITGRGFFQYNVGNQPDGYYDHLDTPTYEDMFWQPKGGAHLEEHLFRGRMNRWKPQKDVEDKAKAGVYDAKQVQKLKNAFAGTEYIISPTWENYDFSNRFLPLGLSPEANNYVGETMYHFVEWELMHKGQYFYIVFDPYSSTWVRFEKLKDVNSSGYSHWMSFASHEDQKNFASKGFADDLYPIAVMMQDQLNEDAENRRRRGSGARAYDKDMFPDVASLDLAMTGRDRLVPADTKGGTKKIADGIYHFETPDISGSVDALKYLEALAGRNLGIPDTSQGDNPNPNATVGVTLQETAGASKRLSYSAQPIIEVGQELGLRVFTGVKDYLDEPMAIKLIGEDGYQMWDYLRRTDLNIKRPFAINISSANKENQMDQMANQRKMEALDKILQPKGPDFEGNAREVDAQRLRMAGWSEQDIVLILDPNDQASKETLSQVSADIQTMMKGKVPEINYAANAFYFSKLFDWLKTHQGDPKVKKNLQVFNQYMMSIAPIAQDNEARRAQDELRAAQRTAILKSASEPQPAAPGGGMSPMGGPPNPMQTQPQPQNQPVNA